MAEEKHKGLETPGSLVLVLIWLVFFITFYYLNFKWLSGVWYVE
jgi:hypothetical protein